MTRPSKVVGFKDKYSVECIDLFSSTDVVITDEHGIERYSKKFSRPSDAKKHYQEITSFTYKEYLT